MIQQFRTQADNIPAEKPEAAFYVSPGKQSGVILKIAVISIAALLVINVIIFSADILNMLVLTHRE